MGTLILNSNLAARKSGIAVNVSTRHLTKKSSRRFKCFLSINVSGLPKLSVKKDEFHYRFSINIAHRHQAELQAASETYPVDLTATYHQLRYAPDCNIDC